MHRSGEVQRMQMTAILLLSFEGNSEGHTMVLFSHTPGLVRWVGWDSLSHLEIVGHYTQ